VVENVNDEEATVGEKEESEPELLDVKSEGSPRVDPEFDDELRVQVINNPTRAGRTFVHESDEAVVGGKYTAKLTGEPEIKLPFARLALIVNVAVDNKGVEENVYVVPPLIVVKDVVVAVAVLTKSLI
jgi:hypothetical protein